MKITLRRRGDRHQLACQRDDGSVTRADLGPSLPFHDLAHFVAESALGIDRGFFGNVRDGYSIQALAEPELIRSLGPESWQAEVAARGLGALATGACAPEQLAALVNDELEQLGVPVLADGLDAASGAAMLERFRSLVDAYTALADGEPLVLQFPDDRG